MKNDVRLGCGVSNVEDAQNAIGNEYTLIDIGGDVEILQSTLKTRVSKLNETLDIKQE